MDWQRDLLGLLAGIVLAAVTTPVGVSGAVFLLPFQLSVLHVPSPRITPTKPAVQRHLRPRRYPDYLAAVRLPLDEVCSRFDWAQPWMDRVAEPEEPR